MRNLIITLLTIPFALSLVACGQFEPHNKDLDQGSSNDDVIQQLSLPNNDGDLGKSIRMTRYRVENGVATETLYLHVLLPVDRSMSIDSLSIDGTAVGEGSYFDNYSLMEIGTIDQEDNEQQELFENLLRDREDSEELWALISTVMSGAQYVVLKGFSHAQLRPFQSPEDKTHPIEISVTLEGEEHIVQSEFHVPGDTN